MTAQPKGKDIAPGITLTRLAAAAREAIKDGVDPTLALSYVIWPPESLTRRAAA